MKIGQASCDGDAGRNPFSTRFVAPGKLPFLFANQAEKLRVQRLCERHDYFGQIVGPHGSGKTTLTFDIESWLPARFIRIVRLTIDSKAGWLAPPHVRTMEARQRSENPDSPSQTTVKAVDRTMYFVDGLERLPPLHWLLLTKSLRRSGHGMIVTTHRSYAGIPILTRTTCESVSLKDITSQIIQQHFDDASTLTRVAQTIRIANDANDLSKRSHEAGIRQPRNVRELLMHCYDIYESQISEPHTG